MAVNRRQKENDTFSDIALTLPIEENAKELDKASILRIAIHYLRLRDVLADCEPDPPEGKILKIYTYRLKWYYYGSCFVCYR